MFQKPNWFLVDAPTKRIIIVGPDEHEADVAKSLLGLWATASKYCGTTQYRLHQLDGYTTHDATELLKENK